ncbi:MAG: tRNA 2-thiouridine(34) synthase MnmA [Actinomycetota bacterium]
MSGDMLQLFLADSTRRGPAPDGAFSGAAGGAACGDLARISLAIEAGRVSAVSFDADGCAATRAACAAAAELVEGETVLDAARIGSREIDAALGGVSPAMRHAVGLASDALHRALSAAASSGQVLADPVPDRVLVAMSGGVDSATAALLERENGTEVVAVTLKLWADRETDGKRSCCSPEAVVSARDLAHSLDLPHLTLDLEQSFRREVVGEFLAGYAAGRTPNPCVICNGEVRIEAMIELARRVGAVGLATGHYARIVEDGAGPLLAAAADPAKDQSYMLSALRPELLSRLRFPLAGLRKPQVRAIAERAGLPVAGKRDSQDLCFLAGQGKRAFLRRHAGLRDREGDLVDDGGRPVGRHRGHHHFTVGQRRGIGVAAPEPLYVLATDAAANTVTVGIRAELATGAVTVRDAVLHRPGRTVDRVRLRYRSKPVACAPPPVAEGRHELLGLELAEPVARVAPGQVAALMCGETIVGHGTIAAA